jgi:cytidylate kinase
MRDAPELHIKISGPMMSGKTTVAQMLVRMFRMQGIVTTLVDEPSSVEFPHELHVRYLQQLSKKGLKVHVETASVNNHPMYKSARAKTFEMTEEDFREASNNNEGRCIACGAEVGSGIEPDARNYKCEECGQEQVFGMDELLLDALVSFTVDTGG